MAGTPKNKLDVDDVAGERDTSILDDAGAAADANADDAALLPGRISTSKDEEVDEGFEDEGSEDEDQEEGRDFFSPEAQNNEASYTINEFQMAIAKPKVHAVTRIGLLSAKPKKHKYIIYPVSKFYFLWSEFMWIMVLYTLAILPMEIAFQEIGGNVFLEVVDVAITFFFFVNILITFRTAIAVHDPRVMERWITDPRTIAIKYIKKWFWLDLIATVPWDMIAVAIISAEGGLATSEVHALEAFRLLRLFRIVRYAGKWQEDTRSKLSQGAIRLLKMCAYTYLIGHWIGCLWYALSVHEGFGESQLGILASEHLEQLPMIDKYVRCIHWGIWATIGIGGELRPETTNQTLLCFVVILAGVYVFASILGNISVIMTQMDASSMRFQERVAGLHEFMNSRKGIDKEKQEHVMKYIYHSWKITKGINERDLLVGLPQELAGELYQSMHKEYLTKCSFFAACNEGFLNALCTQMEFEICLSKDLVLRQGGIGYRVYLIVKGQAQLIDMVTRQVYGRLEEGQLFGEMILFSKHHKRTVSVRAVTFMEIITFSKNRFLSLLEHFPDDKKRLRDHIRNRRKIHRQQAAKLLEMSREQLKLMVASAFSSKAEARRATVEMAKQWRKRASSTGQGPAAKRAVGAVSRLTKIKAFFQYGSSKTRPSRGAARMVDDKQSLLLDAFQMMNAGDPAAVLDAPQDESDNDDNDDNDDLYDDDDDSFMGEVNEMPNKTNSEKAALTNENKKLKRNLARLASKLDIEIDQQEALNAKMDKLAELFSLLAPGAKKHKLLQAASEKRAANLASVLSPSSSKNRNQQAVLSPLVVATAKEERHANEEGKGDQKSVELVAKPPKLAIPQAQEDGIVAIKAKGGNETNQVAPVPNKRASAPAASKVNNRPDSRKGNPYDSNDRARPNPGKQTRAQYKFRE